MPYLETTKPWEVSDELYMDGGVAVGVADTTHTAPPSFINQAARDGAYFDRERRAGARDQILYNKDLHAESINERD